MILSNQNEYRYCSYKMKESIEKRDYTRDQVKKLLDARQEMLVQFCELAGVVPYQIVEPGMMDDPVNLKIKAFCQKMIDYIATGHFVIYKRLASGSERRQRVLNVAAQVYSAIEDTTDIAIAFNDKYDEHDHVLDLSNLSSDLAMLGEMISGRADHEDRLINALTS